MDWKNWRIRNTPNASTMNGTHIAFRELTRPRLSTTMYRGTNSTVAGTIIVARTSMNNASRPGNFMRAKA